MRLVNRRGVRRAVLYLTGVALAGAAIGWNVENRRPRPARWEARGARRVLPG
ncbi:hypothetical protein [Bailinhaonella thermotolerans]|uniref:hypothetical protein n=1 Tax=Bailinhaonella thermotolerans TaxID=1070861 RepID=UPI00192A5FC3|nr:hypothetical protein [Bailinhaonella thermotolerans]